MFLQKYKKFFRHKVFILHLGLENAEGYSNIHH